MLKFKEILWYISWLSSGGQTERERERHTHTHREREKERERRSQLFYGFRL